MILFLTLIVSAAAFDKAGLKSGLQSTEGQLKLFKQWTENEHADYSAKEKSFRFRVFRKHLQEIVAINEAQDMYELDANFMAGLTEEEQQQWYGINITALPAPVEEADESALRSHGPLASSKLWREEGKVTPVKNQRSCGSCWTFGGMVAFEGHYAIKTGGLKTFAEQEFLDCVYEGQRDGCQGGWYWLAFDMLKRTQHLSLAKDYPYVARDGRCLTKSKPNGMIAAQVVETVRPRRSRNDGSLVQALNEGPVAMAFEIKGGFSYYKKGVLSVRNCGSTPHHAMGVTGYTDAFFEIKNSWGSTWGDRGYVRFDRRIENMCGISNWLAYPKLRKTGDDDDDVTPTKDDDKDDTCVDKHERCKEWADRGECKNNYRYMGPNCAKSCGICGCNDGFPEDCGRWKDSGYCEKSYTTFMKLMCKKTCGLCTDDKDDKKCPDGLKFCDGKCQHEHFCH